MKDKKATILIDLEQSKDEIFKKFSKDLRWGIRRAEKEGLILEEVHDSINWQLFIMIFKEKWWAVHPKIEEMVKQWRKDGSRRLFFAYKPETSSLVGFAVVKNMDDRLNMEYLSHTHDEFISWRINDFLYWRLILKAKEEGLPYFDVGGYQLGARGKTDKVNKYKEQFNGELVITEVKGNLFYILGRKIVRRFPWMTRMRKRLQGYKFND